MLGTHEHKKARFSKMILDKIICKGKSLNRKDFFQVGKYIITTKL